MAQFIQARNCRPGRRKAIRLVVWHDMESPETPGTAGHVAEWFAGATAPMASAHACGDSGEVVESVKPQDTAFAAPGANADGYHLEVAGIRNQGRAGWNDAASLATIRNLVRWLASLAAVKGIPDRWLTDAQLADGVSAGHCTHEDISRVFRLGDHSDTGPDFPRGYVMEQLAALRRPVAPPPASSDRWLRRTNPPLVGQDVLNVKHALTVAGNLLDPSNVYDQGTADLIASFQQRHGIPERGVGPLTWAALRKIVH